MRSILSIFGTCSFALSLAACGADPQTVCDHVEQLTVAEAAKAGLGAAGTNAVVGELDKKSCVFTWKHKADRLGIFRYRTLSNCMVAAASLEEASKCSVN